MVTVSDEAAAKVAEMLEQQRNAGFGLREAVMGGGCSGFQVENPNARTTCGCGESFSV